MLCLRLSCSPFSTILCFTCFERPVMIDSSVALRLDESAGLISVYLWFCRNWRYDTISLQCWSLLFLVNSRWKHFLISSSFVSLKKLGNSIGGICWKIEYTIILIAVDKYSLNHGDFLLSCCFRLRFSHDCLVPCIISMKLNWCGYILLHII